MLRLDPTVLVQHLAIDKFQKPIKKHPTYHDITEQIEGEVDKIHSVKFIQEVIYLMWLAT